MSVSTTDMVTVPSPHNLLLAAPIYIDIGSIKYDGYWSKLISIVSFILFLPAAQRSRVYRVDDRGDGYKSLSR